MFVDIFISFNSIHFFGFEISKPDIIINRMNEIENMQYFFFVGNILTNHNNKCMHVLMGKNEKQDLKI